MVAGKTEARSTSASGPQRDPRRCRRSWGRGLAAAAGLEEAFPRQRLDEFVKTGGWDPDGTGPQAERAAEPGGDAQ